MGEMQEQSDAQLLRAYAESGHEPAFREIVTRHTDLVYSAALRQMDSSDLARDVAQSVFTDLARKARPLADKLTDGSSLVGWLYRSTRFAALNHLRDDRRRLAHERQAMEQLITHSETAPDWERVRPVLDEAMADLSDEDREALLLRYFKNHDFRAVGQALGVSDDAAQKRVSRAVERLREFFAKRGVTVGAGGLVVVISANAVQAAPVGLAVAISASAALAGATVAATATATTAKTIAMTTLQKTLVATTLAAAIGTGIYEARQASQLRAQLTTIQQQRLPATVSPNDAALPALQDKINLLAAQNTTLTSALAQANADKARLDAEREQARHSAVLFKQLVEQANSQDTNPTNEYPTPRHLWAAFGRFGRLSALSKADDSKLSPEEKSALEAARMKALEGLPNLVKAFKYYDEAKPTGADSQADDGSDYAACLLYGALNLDEQQFGQVYSLIEKYQQEGRQKGLSETNSVPDKAAAMKLMIEQFKVEMQPLLTPEQAGIFEEVLTHIQFEPGKSSINFNF